MTLLGIVGETNWGTERIVSLKPNEVVSLRSYDLTFDGLTTRQGPNYRELTAKFTVRSGGEVIDVMEPSKRSFATRKTSTTEAALMTPRRQPALCFARRRQRRRLDRGAHLSQAAGAADLARRGGDGARRRAVAVRPAAARRRAEAGAQGRALQPAE